MQVTNVDKARTVKTVTIENVVSETDSDIVRVALKAAGETRGSIFGSRMERRGATVIVSLYTD